LTPLAQTPDGSAPITCACILLAAGASSRLGYPKQLLQVNGETLLYRTARLALAAGVHSLYVVLGCAADELRPALLTLPAAVLINEHWQTGMASSLRAGLEALSSNITHALVLVCDQVSLSADQLDKLLTEAHAHPRNIIASTYQGRSGVPAIFPADCFRSLQAIDGDRGARDFLQRHADRVMSITFEQGSQDIDTPDDVASAGLTLGKHVHIDDKSAESHKK
jgi:molybdenum cofactor cytidylyltransferase